MAEFGFSLAWRLVLMGFVTLCNLRSFSTGDQWQSNVRPKLFAHLTDRDYQSFAGILRESGTSGGLRNNSDFFTTMLYTNIVQDVLVVGARNILYKLDAQEFRLTQAMRWPSLEAEVEKCHVKGKEHYECQNYIKVLQQYKVGPSSPIFGCLV